MAPPASCLYTACSSQLVSRSAAERRRKRAQRAVLKAMNSEVRICGSVASAAEDVLDKRASTPVMTT